MNSLSLTNFFSKSTASHLAYAFIDFKNNKTHCSQYISGKKNSCESYYDLSSLTKPLTLSLYFFMHPEELNEENKWLLNHCGGLPPWGYLKKNNWEKYILDFPLKKSYASYSDFSALRLMLEIGASKMEERLKSYWKDEIVFWKDLPPGILIADNGEKKNCVQDPRALLLDTFTSHAGCFSSIQKLANFILRWEKDYSLLQVMQREIDKNPKDKFVYGWDRPSGKNSLAGQGYSTHCFGHLGFTGTCFWFDALHQVGLIILSNVTRLYHYDRFALNDLRKELASYCWSKEWT